MTGNPSHRVTAEVRAHMARQGIGVNDLAAQMGVTPMWLSRRLRGVTRLTVDDLARVAAALDVDPASLLTTPA